MRSHVLLDFSTGGGLFLECFEGEDLPAFTALKECGA
jgi:3-phosphoglycerate kinase